MKKAVSIFAMIVILVSFAPPENQPKEISVKLTIEEANAVISAIQSSDNISAKQASLIVSKINTAYAVAIKDSSKNDSTKTKKP